jgi:hypothetical protein
MQRFKIGMTFRVVRDVVRDQTGALIAEGVDFLWHARAGFRFMKGDEFTISDITGEALWVTSSSHRVDGKEVCIFKRTLKEALESGMAQEVHLNPNSR